MALQTYQQLAADLARDDAGKLTAEQVDGAIARAVAALSEAMPRELTVEQTGVSGQKIAVPTGWVAGISRLVDIEWPVGEVPRTLIEPGRIELLTNPDGSQQIGLHDALPAAATIRTRFTAPHDVDGQDDTVPAHLQWGVGALAASILCGQLASAYANQTDSTIAADRVEGKSKSELFASREREYMKQAYTSWGLPVPGAKGAASEGSAAGAQVSFGSRRGTAIERGLRWN